MPEITISKTIKVAMENIATNHFVIPAIQRKFVWDVDQIETLFDSIMRDYPINGFMLWHVEDPTIRKTQKFYEFLKDYQEDFNEDNPEFKPEAKPEFYAVIDGQQRLTSLFIGLFGTYRYRKSNKWRRDTEDSYPTRRLYLNLSRPLSSQIDNQIDNQKEYEFKFLTDDEVRSYEGQDGYFWFRVGDIASLEYSHAVSFLVKNNLCENEFAKETLMKLVRKYHTDEVLNYTIIAEQNQDKVLDIFVRTNSGGTPLSFSDLLMSISSANWTHKDARKEIADVKRSISGFGNPNFNVSQDFILKAMLVFESEDIRFKLDNFGIEQVRRFEQKWDDIKKALVATFELLESLGYSDSLLVAKNAAIPIAYWLYKNNLADAVSKPSFPEVDKKAILKWLDISLLKRIFGGHSDTILLRFRKVIKDDSSGRFPFGSIVAACAGDPVKNYSFDDDFLDGVLSSQYQSPQCTFVLQLLYPDKVIRYGKAVAQDHMHPKTIFEDRGKLAELKLPDERRKVFLENYNTVLNLQLLGSGENGQTAANRGINASFDANGNEGIGNHSFMQSQFQKKLCAPLRPLRLKSNLQPFNLSTFNLQLKENQDEHHRQRITQKTHHARMGGSDRLARRKHRLLPVGQVRERGLGLSFVKKARLCGHVRLVGHERRVSRGHVPRTLRTHRRLRLAVSQAGGR